MEIKVKSCADCQIRYTDLCTVSSKEYIKNRREKSTPPSCPLKQQSITVKLEEAKRPLYDGCATCKNNVDGIDSGIWCITHCINGSKYEKL